MHRKLSVCRYEYFTKSKVLGGTSEGKQLFFIMIFSVIVHSTILFIHSVRSFHIC